MLRHQPPGNDQVLRGLNPGIMLLLAQCPYVCQRREDFRMAGLALAMFVGLFAFGQQIMGYDDPHGRVQLTLLATFTFGVLIGYRAQS